MKKLPLPFCLFMLVVCLPCTVDAQDGPLRLGVAGLSHGHIAEVEKRVGRGDFIVVGIAEKDAGLLESNSLARSSDPSILFSDISEMVAETRPEAVIAFGSVYDHMEVVESCAPLGIDVMVEKPLAVNMKHARRMAALAREYGILLLTNYETTWYDTNHDVKKIVDEGGIGDIIRMNIFDGHNGPVGIGCGP